MIWKYFYSERSAGDHGTLYQLRNRLNRTNVAKKPKNDMNACEDFIEIVTSGHIVAAALETFQLDSTDDTPSNDVVPNAQDVWTQPHSTRQACLDKWCKQIFDTFVGLSYNNLKSSLCPRTERDGVSSYSVQVLRLGCLFMEFADAIREGDGEHVLRCWRYLMPIFLSSGCRNYACESANMLLQYSYALSPTLANDLLWSRFVNVHGRPGKNIAVDLHMEHLNRLAKDAIRFQGANKTKRAIERVGRSIGTLSPVLLQFDTENSISTPSSGHNKSDPKKTLTL